MALRHSYCLSLLAGHTKPGASVLDGGSGSGYLTAVFGLMVGETGHTVGVEHIPELVKRSIDAIKQTPAGHLMDKGRIVVHVADGKLGNEEGTPYNCIHVGAAAAGGDLEAMAGSSGAGFSPLGFGAAGFCPTGFNEPLPSFFGTCWLVLNCCHGCWIGNLAI